MTLGRLDHDTLNLMAESYQTKWTHTDELLATIAEMLDSLLRVTILANAKNPQLPRPFHYRRPSEKQAGPTVLTPRQLAQRMIGKG